MVSVICAIALLTPIAISPPVLLYMGRDKVENEELIKYGFPEDVW